MNRVPIDQLQPGMSLEANVLDRNGRVLLRARTALTERHLRALKIWGVSEASVLGARQEEARPRSRDVSVDPAAQAAAESALRERFRHADTAHPFVAELYRQCLLRVRPGVGVLL
jgi:hypothetical protein